MNVHSRLVPRQRVVQVCLRVLDICLKYFQFGLSMKMGLNVVQCTYGPKAAGREKVLCVSLNSPHSERPPGQTAGPSNLPFWILGDLDSGNLHKNFQLPGMPGNVCRKGLKFPEIPGKSELVIIQYNPNDYE